MSDFLRRLAGRTLGVEPVMEPVSPGVFGPLEPSFPDDEPVEDEAVWPERREPLTKRPAAERADASQVEPTTREQPTPPPGARPDQPLVTIEAANRDTVGDDGPVAPDRAAAQEPAVTAPLVAPAEPAPEPLFDRDGTSADLSVRAVPRPAGQRRGATRSMDSPSRVMPFPVLVPAASAAEPLLDAPRVLETPAPRQAETPPPPVRITIGRVDVRAMPAPPPAEGPRARAPEEPRLSLSEYLKRGGGGG